MQVRLRSRAFCILWQVDQVACDASMSMGGRLICTLLGIFSGLAWDLLGFCVTVQAFTPKADLFHFSGQVFLIVLQQKTCNRVHSRPED